MDIHLDERIDVPHIAVCPSGNIRLHLPPDWSIDEALESCKEQLLGELTVRFRNLFEDRYFPRLFQQSEKSVIISPDLDQLPNPQDYFSRIFGV